MKDIQRVWALWWLAALPFIVASIVIIIVTGVTITASSQLTMRESLLLVVTAVFGLVIFWKSDRIRHYNRVFAEHEENYRYEEKKIERLDLSDTKMRDVDPAVCEHIIQSLEPMIQHLQSLVDQFTRMPIAEIPEEAQ